MVLLKMKKPLIIYMEPDLHTVLKSTAKQEGRSMSATICQAFREHVAQQEIRNAALNKLGVKI
jgi:predicted transcriptional regulator